MTPQHHIIKETSDTISRLLQDEFKRNGYKRVHIIDGAPKPDAVEGKLPAVSVYLYQMAVDPDGTDYTPHNDIVEIPQEDGTVKEFMRRRPMWVRLDYLISAWAQTPEDEQLLLGLLVRTIFETPVVPKEKMRGATFDADFEMLFLLQTRLDEGTLSRFWGSLNQPVRPAIQAYTFVPIIPEKLEEFKRVESRELQYRSMTDPRVKEQGPSPNPFTRKLDLGGGRRGGG